MDTIFNHKFIVFGTYSPNTLGQIRSLGEKGIKPIVVLVYKNTFRIDKSKYISKLYDVKNIEEGLGLIVEKYGFEKYTPFIYTDRDDIMGLLDRNYDQLKDRFYFWNAGEQGRLNKYLNKKSQIQLAKECGFDVIATEVVRIGELPRKLLYPIFTKAVDSLNPWWKGFTHICNDEKQLIDAYSQMKDISEIILQQYIEKKDEMPINCISLNGGRVIKTIGRTVYYRLQKDSFGSFRYVRSFEDKELEKKIKLFIMKVGYTGPFQIEFIVDKSGKKYFLETNFRLAQQDYAFTKLGINVPYEYAMAILNGNMVFDNEIRFDRISIMSEFEDFRISCLHGDVSFWQWMKDVCQTDCFQFYNKDDLLPFFYTLWSKIKQTIKHKL